MSPVARKPGFWHSNKAQPQRLEIAYIETKTIVLSRLQSRKVLMHCTIVFAYTRAAFLMTWLYCNEVASLMSGQRSI